MCTVVVLAGGKGGRAGNVYKPLIVLEGEPIMVRVLEALKKLKPKVYIIVKTYEHAAAIKEVLKEYSLRASILFDNFKNVYHPLTAIYTFAMSRMCTTTFACLAADMPHVGWRSVKYILDEAMKNEKCIVPRWKNGYVEPLYAAYHIHKLRAVLTKNDVVKQLPLRYIIEKLEKFNAVKYVPAEYIVALEGKDVFENINTLQRVTPSSLITRQVTHHR